MKRLAAAISCVIVALPSSVSAQVLAGWTPIHLGALKHWVQQAKLEALPDPATTELDAAIATGEQTQIDSAATKFALDLARLYQTGSTPSARRTRWHIVDTDGADTLVPALEQAIAQGAIDRFFADLRPAHPDYTLLVAAYARETDPARRSTLALNLDRWRWLPKTLGDDYVLVNVPQFEASRWRNGVRTGTWRVVTGKTSSPTPVFNAMVTGVTFNPWWNVPANIVRESVGALVRRNPSLARARGYVWDGGRYRQRPGPQNSLGQMKLVMPNPYSVYLHDTPSKNLFDRDIRAFSHGCVRVGGAIEFATNLLSPALSREKVDAIVASGKTVTVQLPHHLPVYITYFTAAGDASGGLVFKPDIYGRDAAALSPPGAADTECTL